MARHLVLRLEAPLAAWGGVVVDGKGPVTDFPGLSTLTGLVANSLGWDWSDADSLSRLQARLVYGARIDRCGGRILDFQTVTMARSDRAWTTRGRVEGRAGGERTYDSPQIRERSYDADVLCTVALRLEPADEDPDLDAVAAALASPARTLFLGRKPCLPSGPVMDRIVEADDVASALLMAPLGPDEAADEARRFGREPPPVRMMLPQADPARDRDLGHLQSDERSWRTGVHAGQRHVRLRSMPRGAFEEMSACR